MQDKYEQYLYHITSRSKLPNILREGLIPCIGVNSSKVNEKDIFIYLSDYSSLPYWEIILGNDVVIRVENVKHSDCKVFNYSIYREFVYNKHIQPEKLTVIDAPSIQKKHMVNLCKEYLKTISFVTVSAARYYNYHKDDALYKEIFECDLNMILSVKDRLDYSVLTSDEIKSCLIEFAESGEYAFTDTYLDTGHKLYEQLFYYDNDSLSNKRGLLYSYIKANFNTILDINTGGWTG